MHSVVRYGPELERVWMTGSTTDEQGAFRCRRTRNPRLISIVALVQWAIEVGKWHIRVNEPIADEMMDRAERFYRRVDSVT